MAPLSDWASTIEWISFLPPFLVGIVLGFFYFGGLWWTVQRLTRSEHPSLLAFISLFVRNAGALLAFYLVTGDRWERLVVCLIGFVLARVVLVQILKPERDNTPPPQKQKNTDPRSHTKIHKAEI